jgi:hypothetical protein
MSFYFIVFIKTFFRVKYAMALNQDQKKELFDLFAALREGAISPDQFKRLDVWLIESREVRLAYLDYFKMCGCLRAFQLAAHHTASDAIPSVFKPDIDMSVPHDISDSALWKKMAEAELTADAVEFRHESKEPETSTAIGISVRTPRINKTSLITFLTATAALVLMILYVYLNPRVTVEVATLVDSIDTKWSEVPFDTSPGSRFATNKGPIRLDRGVARFAYDQGVEVLVEGPAQFQMTTPTEIVLSRGKLYAHVTETGAGFSVKTQNSKIIDLGTEFGVYSDDKGDTQLHVFRGKTKLIAGSNKQVDAVEDVFGGYAKEVSNTGQRIQSIALSQGTFARSIDSQTRSIWRGETVDLADIVAGGDGLQTSPKNRGIDWNGQGFISGQTLSIKELQGSGNVIPVQENPFVDCLFVPSGTGQASVTLTSDTIALKLDDFISRDTNGLITLLITCELSDSDNHFWFSSKEAAGSRSDLLPALIFPQAAGGSAVVTTADKNGADTYVSNDQEQSGKSTHGTESIITVRNFRGNRSKTALFRFDISRITGDRKGVVLRLHLSKGTRIRNLDVYGLKDGPADNWDENTVSYNIAPGLEAAAAGDYKLNISQVESLGTFPVADTSIRITRDKSMKWVTPENAPVASYANPISGYPITSCGVISQEQNSIRQDYTLVMSNIRCGTPDNPSILLAANAGITFDLAMVKSKYTNMKLSSFKAVCGLARAISSAGSLVQNSAVPRANIYVLVDGIEIFSAIDKTPLDEPQPIHISLSGNEKYLTLITTQGSDGGNQNDMCIFLKPVLQMEP